MFLNENILILLSIIAAKKNGIPKYIIELFSRLTISKLPSLWARNIPIRKSAVAGVGNPENESEDGLVLNIANLNADEATKIHGGINPTQVSIGDKR